ncbi:Glutamate receptor ionotropic, kainate 2 [Portunus trituberculatus]|uniref:Glutamate receptor ionotropic, kainate 2 n=1 Tax=Portunus trituberculatus TaxID=210409 RepID=A0A5B7IYM2_PORTR|nr:Glutamate receptor ionotropic, kainate 2 [Portunus trituberculatus]
MAAIFGPQSENTANHVQSICDNKEIPHIETRYDYKLTRDEYSINLHPYPPALSQVSGPYLYRFGLDDDTCVCVCVCVCVCFFFLCMKECWPRAGENEIKGPLDCQFPKRFRELAKSQGQMS